MVEIAAGRDHIKTAEFANAINRATQTVRKNYCLTGECFGIRPVKVRHWVKRAERDAGGGDGSGCGRRWRLAIALIRGSPLRTI